MNTIQESLSFDDVLIEPRYSEIESRRNIKIYSRLTKNISLHLPLISSPMDTITEANMAISMATNGGLGIVHRYNTIEQQVDMIKKVKRYLSFIIENPYTIYCNEKEFSSLDYGNKVFYAAYQYILQFRNVKSNHPIYITDIDLPFSTFRISNLAQLQTIHYLNYKQKIEDKFNV